MDMKIETKKGLWVSSLFTETFGTKEITPSKTVPGFKKLERPMNDSEIKKEFGVGECTLEDVAAFLNNLPEGTDDGYSNIFYVAGFVVLVCWLPGNQGWLVSTRSLDDDNWNAGYRVFSRNRPSDPQVIYSDTYALVNLEARIEALEEWRDSFRKILTNAIDTMP